MDLPPAPRAAPRRRPWFRRVLVGLGLLVLAVALAPFYADPLARGLVERRLARTLDAEVSLRGLDVSWPARARLTGLEVKAADGSTLLTVQEASASVELGALLGGRLRASASVLYPEVHLRREADGRWNWERVAARLAGPDDGSDESSGTDDAAPDVALALALQEGRVVLHGPGGDGRVEGLTVHLDVDDLARPAPFEVSWRLRGPGGPGGSGRVSGSIAAAPEGRLDPLEAIGSARVELSDVDLGALTPALAGLLPVDEAGGIASGTVQLELGRGLALAGNADVELREVRAQGPLAGAPPTVVRSLRVVGRAEVTPDGNGTQHLEVHADEWLGLAYDGTTRVVAGDGATLTGTLTLTGDLGGLTGAARSWIPFQPGVRVDGRLQQSVQLSAELDARRPRLVRIETQGGLHALSATDARGRALDLSALDSVALDLVAEADLRADTARVPSLHLALGPVQVEAEARLTGLATSPRLDEGRGRLVADLERLRGTLEQVVALAPGAFGGHLEASGELSGTAQALDFRGRLTARELALSGLSLTSAEGLVEGHWAPAGESRAAGDLTLGPWTLRREDSEAPLAWPGTRASARATRLPQGHLTLAARIDGEDGALAGTLEGEGELTADLTGELTLRPTWSLAIGSLVEHLRVLVPDLANLDGRIDGQGALRLVLAADGQRVTGTLTTNLNELGARGPGGLLVSLPGASAATAELRLALALPAGELAVEQVALRCEALRASATARLTDLLGETPRLAAATLALDSDLDALGALLAAAVDTGGARLGGGALRAEADVVAQGTAFEVRGHGTAASLRWSPAEGAPLEQRDLHGAFDLSVDPVTGSLVARTLELGSATLDAELRGRLDGLADPDSAQGELHLALDGELEHLLGDLGLETAGGARSTAGKLHARYSLAGTRGEFRLEGASTVEGFRLSIAAGAPDGAPLVIAEPRIELGLAAQLTLPALDVVVERASITSQLARGGAGGRLPALRPWLLGEEGGELVLEGWSGELIYVPERLGAVLAPWLPGRLTGAEERRVTLVFEGRARDLDLATLLIGSRGHVDLAMGKLVRPEIEVEGDLGLDLAGGRTKVRGELAANGGRMSLDGDLALEGAPGAPAASTLALEVRDLSLNAGLAPLLAYAHPAFGSLDLARGQLGGLVALSLHLDYGQPIPAAALTGDWQALSTTPLHGTGRLEIRGAALRGSPLLAALSELGLNVERDLDLRPIEFTIEKGRLTYARPWTWTLAGTETTFSGSVGLDHSVDLLWNVPVTESLVKRWSFLEPLLGERIAVPIGGTVTRPRLDAKGVIEGLGKELARKELEGRLGLGGGGDPARLLAEADRLFDQGKKAEAAPLYQRLRDEFKLSLVYALNKDRIKDRAKFPR